MKKLLALTKRNTLEIVRDPLALIFCVAFPVVMLILMQLIFSGLEFIPPMFEVQNYAIGICVFGYCFVTMFIAMKIAGDKNTSFIKRINILPIKKTTYLLSFFICAFIISLVQTLLFLALAIPFGLKIDLNLVFVIIYLIPSMIFYISVGLLLGILLNKEEKVGPVASILVSLTGLLGGVFMPLESFTGGFKAVINLLPFSHSTLIANVYTAGVNCIYPHILYLSTYIFIIWIVIICLNKNRT